MSLLRRFLTGSALKRRPAHISAGVQGEAAAARYLQRQRYSILGRNVRLGKNEIDIIAFDPEDKVLVFAEVKTRTHRSPDYHPDLSITPLKRERMRRSARRWIAQHDYDGGYRLDVLCVAENAVIDHYKEIDWSTR